jgi:hypothetical protein
MNIIELAKQTGFERLGHDDDDWVCYPEEIEAFAALVAAQVRARCIELVLAGTDMPVQTRTLEALQRDRKRIAKLIEEDGKP